MISSFLYFVLYILAGIVVAYLARRGMGNEEPEMMRNLMLVIAWPMIAFILLVSGADIGLELLFDALDDHFRTDDG